MPMLGRMLALPSPSSATSCVAWRLEQSGSLGVVCATGPRHGTPLGQKFARPAVGLDGCGQFRCTFGDTWRGFGYMWAGTQHAPQTPTSSASILHLTAWASGPSSPVSFASAP